MNDEQPVQLETPPAPAPMEPPPITVEVPPPPPPEPPKPEVDLATKVMRVCEEYRPRLFAIKSGLFKPEDLVNNAWTYYSALTEDDRAYLSGHIVNAFRELEKKLTDEMNAKIASLIGR